MISYLEGRLVRKTPAEALIEVGGIGYSLKIPLSSFQMLGETGHQVRILTHLAVRDDHLELYGFATEEEREVFQALVSVTGIGSRLAIGILSGISPDSLKSAIAQGDTTTLSSVRGVGRKTAERIVVELRGRFSTPSAPTVLLSRSGEEAISALIALGIKPHAARASVMHVLEDSPDLKLEEIVRKALKEL
jgi:Holliday junction DNA helicase RuvA